MKELAPSYRIPLLALAALVLGVMLIVGPFTSVAQADLPSKNDPNVLDGGGSQLGGPTKKSPDAQPKDQNSGNSKSDKAASDKPPTEDCGMVDFVCHGNNILITVIWYIVKIPVLLVEKMLGGIDRMGLALPSPSGALVDKYQSVSEKVRPMVLIGMLMLGVLMMVRSANYNSTYLVQTALPRIGLAVLGLAFFPQIAQMIADLSNGLSSSFYKDADVVNMLVQLIDDSIIANVTVLLATLVNPAGWTVAGIIAAIFLVPVLIMVALLFIITYLNSLFFSLLILVGPIALGCYAIPGLSAVTGAWFKGVLAAALAPVLLSIEIMLMTWAGTHTEAIGAGKFTTIVIAVLMLWMMVKTPGKVYHWAFGSFGGGEGGSFLAGMGARSLMRMGARALVGGSTGGLGTAAASLGAAAGLGGAASRGVGGAVGTKGVASVARDLSKQQFSSTGGFGGVGQAKARKDYQKILGDLQGQPGGLQAVRGSGANGLKAKSTIEEIQSQVHGGSMDPQEASRKIGAIQQDHQANKEQLANNLASGDPAKQEGYQRLIEAEEGFQLAGEGSKVAAMAPPSTDDRYEAPTSDGDELARYTARIANEQGTVAPAQANGSPTPTTDTAGGSDGGGAGLTAEGGAVPGAAQPAAANLQNEGGQTPYGTPQPVSESNAPPGTDAARSFQATQPDAAQSQPQPQPGQAGYAPERFTQAAMDQPTASKADQMMGFIASDPSANSTYNAGLSEDKRLRNEQAGIHHQAMRNQIQKPDAQDQLNNLQSKRRQNLDAVSKDLRAHYSTAKASGSIPNLPSRGLPTAKSPGRDAPNPRKPGSNQTPSAPGQTGTQSAASTPKPSQADVSKGVYNGAGTGAGLAGQGMRGPQPHRAGGPITQSDWKSVMGSDFDLRYDTASANGAKAGGYEPQSSTRPHWVPYESPDRSAPASSYDTSTHPPYQASANTGRGADFGSPEPRKPSGQNPQDESGTRESTTYDSTPDFEEYRRD